MKKQLNELLLSYVRWIHQGEGIVTHIATAIPLPELVVVVVHGANPNGFVFCRMSNRIRIS